MNEYDVSAAFQQIEEILIQSMTRNLGKHVKDQDLEGFDWTMWQAEQLKALKQYREENAELFQGYFSTINSDIETALLKANATGKLSEEQKILRNLLYGYKPKKVPETFKEIWQQRKENGLKYTVKKMLAMITGGTLAETEGAFFKVNDRKLTALINATRKDMQHAETAVLRMANDKYRKIIFNAQVYANSGAGTVWQAVDMATKDFLSAGINCIQYADGRRVNIASYAEMAIRTANRRAYLLGEGAKRDEWGVHTVLVSQYGASSQTCLPWQGKVYIDDVYSGGKPDGEHELLSTAIAGGLFHPNCRHTTTTFFEGINTEPTPMAAGRTEENSALEQKQRYNERQIRKYKRLEMGSLTQENIDKYKEKRIYWQQRNNEFIAAHSDVLRRDYERESTRGLVSKPPDPKWKPSVVIPEPTASIKPIRNNPLKPTSKLLTALSVEHRTEVIGSIERSPENIKAVWNEFENDLVLKDQNYKKTPCYKHGDGVYLNLSDAAKGNSYEKPFEAFFHEFGHHIDHELNKKYGDGNIHTCFSRTYNNGIFGKTIKAEAKQCIENYKSEHPEIKYISDVRTSFFNKLSKTLKPVQRACISDMFEMATKVPYPMGFGHGKGYWKNRDGGVEAFADMFATEITNKDSLEQIKKYFPQSYSIFKEMLEVIEND